MNPIAKALVEDILCKMKLAINEGRCTFADRDKNQRTLSELGIRKSDAFDIVSELTITDYFQGPEIDEKDETSEMYCMFKKVISGRIIYIKFKVIEKNNGTVFLMSFHFDEDRWGNIIG